MSKRVSLELDLPDELADQLRDEDVARKAKEALVMELLREHRISQGTAADILEIAREDLFPLMAKYQVPVVDLSSAELGSELDSPFPTV